MREKGNKKNKSMEELLLRSLDGRLSPKENRRLEGERKRSVSLRKEEEALLRMRESLGRLEKPSFMPHFADRVMERIEKLQSSNGMEALYAMLKAVFRPVALAGAALLIVLLLFNLGIGDSLATEDLFFASDLAVEEILNYPLF